MKDANAIVVNHLTKRFKDQVAVNDISFTVKKGEIFGLLGPNGSGKTTLLKMMTTILKPTSGNAQIFGEDVTKNNQKVRELFGLTGQYASIDEGLSARENLMIFARLNGLTRKQSKERTEALLKEFSLTKSANKKLSDFSGGMRRRLDLAVTLIARPPLIFLDEPTTGLDPRTRQQLWQTIRNLSDQGSTIFLTTQYLDEADALADRVAVIDHGKMIKIGQPAELEAQVAKEKLNLTFESETIAKAAQDFLNKSNPTIKDNVLTVDLENPTQIQAIILALSEHDFKIKDMQVTKPTLDDVFFALTKGTN
ncbi:ATP-binding cassette domain-containing protein [Fructilactobacillus frigidiflavus]|uniref:ATP-binding cassette domain-containing protein n=1 Tax=Fructilactobacillus frigidiflavus TaxID=3242688 RepID=UPI0037575316